MSISRTEWIWHNGAFVRWEEATVHVTAHALHYGTSVFEGLRAYATPTGPAILGVEAHLRRLFDSCRVMRISTRRETMLNAMTISSKTKAAPKSAASYSGIDIISP